MKIKNFINKIISLTGYQLTKVKTSRNSFEGALGQLAKFWRPDIIIDAGAARGSWTEKCFKFFPDASYVLIEPLEEFHPTLKKLQEKIKNTTIIPAAVGAQAGKIILNVHPDLYGSSIKKEVEGEKVDGQEREVTLATLDKIAADNNLNKNILLKLDVQGAELEVLRGATEILKNTECLILEASLFKSYRGGADLSEIIAHLKNLNFTAYDIFGELYRPYDNALSQIDMIFVKESGLFRKFLGYATDEQRKEQNKKFQQELNKLI